MHAVLDDLTRLGHGFHIWCRRISSMTDTLEKLSTALVRQRGLAAVIFWLVDGLLTCAIVSKVPYTEIDWIAYMQEVEGVMGGEYDYSMLKGQTGPLVYPGGFVWVYAGLRKLTNDGKDIAAAQKVFLVIYLVTQAVVMRIYVKTKLVPAWALGLLIVSKRIHSIYVLRMFNDCVAMLFFFVSLLLFIHKRWGWGCIAYSLAVSVKMNILLYAPGLLYLLLCSQGVRKSAALISLCALVQAVVGAPFLVSHPVSYVRGSFDLSRVFMHRWSVNLKFLPEDIFVSKPLALGLLAAHVLLLYAAYTKHLKKLAGTRIKFASGLDDFDPAFICKVMMTANFIGIVCARTIHFQFYSWYFHSLPALLWACPLHGRRGVLLRLALWGLIEIAFNITVKDGCQKTPVSPDCGSPVPEGSIMLTGAHAVMLMSILAAHPWKLVKSVVN